MVIVDLGSRAAGDVAVTLASAAPDDEGCWLVVDTEGRALRLPATEVDRRLVTLHPGQRLRVTVTGAGAVTNGRL